MSSFALRGLLIGPTRPLGARGVASGIAKAAVARALALSETGFSGDAQGDTVRHGGPEKAVHHYPFEHYAAWRDDLGVNPLLERPGAFGENLSTIGLTEDNVAIGDVFELGSALLQTSQGRQPCWRLNERFGLTTMAKQVQASGRTGWYYRVLRPGIVDPQSRLTLVERNSPEWTISRVWRVFYVDTLNRSELARLAELPALAPGWRKLALHRLEANRVEDWSTRLTGDAARGA
jgi:MOSC domain-containing protein YiiM